MNYLEEEKAETIVAEIYPKNNGGYPDPFVNLQDLYDDIDDLCFEMKRIAKAKKTAACKRAVSNLSKWLEEGVMKDGSPIPDYRRKSTQRKIDAASKWLEKVEASVLEKSTVVPKEVLDRNQKEFYDTAVDGLMHK